MNMKKTAIAVAVTAAVGAPATGSAAVVTGSWTGAFTLINPSGSPLPNDDTPNIAPWYTNRTPVAGTMSFDTTTGAGSGTVVPFSFSGGGLAQATNISFQAIGNGFGNPVGNLVLGNIGFNWSGNNGIPVSIVLDATGFYGAGPTYTTGEVITGGATPASDGLTFSKYSYTLPVGPSPMATTTWNTTTIGGAACTLGCNPSGTLPLSADSIGGSPMPFGPFPGWNANFDIKTITITAPVPVPAAVWLFGSGLVGLVGVARRRRKSS